MSSDEPSIGSHPLTGAATGDAAATDLEWLVDVLGGSSEGPSTRYRCHPSSADPRFLVPVASAAVAAASLDRGHDGRTSMDRARAVGARAAARMGVLRLGVGDRVTLPTTAVGLRLALELGEPSLAFAVTIGPRRRNRKPVLQLIRPDGETVGFAKIGWSPLTRRLVANEARWLKTIEGRLPEHVRVPRVVYETTDEDRHIVVTTPVGFDGRPRRRGPLPPSIAAAVALAVPDGQHAIADLAMLETWNELGSPDLLPTELVGDRHGRAVVDIGLWHGDLTPWNTATTQRGTAIWDWEFAAAGRPIGFDLLHDQFETVRRTDGAEAGLRAVVETAGPLLASVAQRGRAEAIVDLYLCELIAREVTLDEGGPPPADLGPLSEVASALLRARLGDS